MKREIRERALRPCGGADRVAAVRPRRPDPRGRQGGAAPAGRRLIRCGLRRVAGGWSSRRQRSALAVPATLPGPRPRAPRPPSRPTEARSRSPRRSAAAPSAAGPSTASACPPTATGSTSRGCRGRASPSSTGTRPPSTSSATTTSSPPPSTTATRSSGARTGWRNGPTATSPRTGHFAGGYGYLNVDGKVLSTLHLDRPAGAASARRFGVGYYERSLRSRRASASARTSTRPFGDDPLLLHDVTIRNTIRPPTQGLVVRVLGRQPLRPVRPLPPRPRLTQVDAGPPDPERRPRPPGSTATSAP